MPLPHNQDHSLGGKNNWPPNLDNFNGHKDWNHGKNFFNGQGPINVNNDFEAPTSSSPVENKSFDDTEKTVLICILAVTICVFIVLVIYCVCGKSRNNAPRRRRVRKTPGDNENPVQNTDKQENHTEIPVEPSAPVEQPQSNTIIYSEVCPITNERHAPPSYEETISNPPQNSGQTLNYAEVEFKK